ncbi:hypothetical protein H8D51_02320 [bacterium]|nr:hypothetical protein [bacterium]
MVLPDLNRQSPGKLLSTQALVATVSAPDCDFNPAELAYFASRRDSRGSRAARSLAKQLLRDWLLNQYGKAPPAADLAIITGGEPPRLLADNLPRVSIRISLAHSATHAACALQIEECP